MKGGYGMSKLRTEYTDIKDIKHKVQHSTVDSDVQKSREQIVEELLNALSKKNKRISA